MTERELREDDIAKNRRGFTITEVLIVIVIMFILYGLATLQFKAMRDRYNVEKQTKEIYTDMMRARLRAMQRGRDHFVSLQTFTMYRIYEDGPPPDGDKVFSAATDSLVATYTLLPSYNMVLMTNPTMTFIQFTSKGLVDPVRTGSMRINPTAGGEYDCIVIDQVRTAMGKVNGTSCDIK